MIAARRLLLVAAAARPLARAASSVVTMPALSPTMTSGKIARWTKKEGDKLSSGDVIGEVETDKATVDFVFQDDGYLAKLLVKEGAEDVAVGSPVCVVVDEQSEVAAAQAAAPPAAAAAAAKPAAAAATQAAKPAAAAAPPAAPKPVAAAPAPVAAPAPAPVAAPVVAAAPKPAPAKAPAPAPAAPASASSTGGYLAFERWGQSLARAPMGTAVGKLQRDYAAAFGYSGHDAIAAPEDKKKPAPAAK